jgi:hypothetical protein
MDKADEWMLLCWRLVRRGIPHRAPAFAPFMMFPTRSCILSRLKVLITSFVMRSWQRGEDVGRAGKPLALFLLRFTKSRCCNVSV